VLQKNKLRQFVETFGDKFYTNTFEDWVFTPDFSHDLLLKHFQTTSLKGFGIDQMEQAIIAAGAALHYLSETQHDRVAHITRISRVEEDHYVWLDRFTIRNLELVLPNSENAVTLLQVIDHTITPMGSRLIRRWITMPLKERRPIEERLSIVEFLKSNNGFREKLNAQLRVIGDMERLISKVAVGRVNPREVLQIRRALFAIEEIKASCIASGDKALMSIGEQMNICMLIRDRIGRELNDDPPVAVNKGGVISIGFNAELDELREIQYSGKDYLARIQQRESQATGITSLKIGYNNVFGYFLEVTNAHKDKVPETWNRKQTLVNAERYITEELKDYEQKILGAEEKILLLETQLFNDLVVALADYVQPVQLNAGLTARLDVLNNFAELAIANKYVRPSLNDSTVLDIRNGRHPVIEKQLPPGEAYVANDIFLSPDNQQIIILTGPNMSGKSALLRQTALIVLLAQIGCYVPADQANIGIVDKVFTRVGASDNISSGESTFMVEMNETASILNNVSDRSLIILDEIGRGTSTYDGISIAWSIVEFLHQHPLFRPKILFATHYHELNEMAGLFARIKNFHISVKEIHNKIIFLRKMVNGGSEHSFGIHVARMAGMPNSVIERANDLLARLEESHNSDALAGNKTVRQQKVKKEDNYQLSFIQLDDPLLLQIKDEIINTNIDTLTPVEALMKLNHIKGLLTKKK
jgi:DNA mismatch repair protein MutS